MSETISPRIDTSGLSPMALGRLNIQLDKLWRFQGKVMSMAAWIDSQETIEKTTSDGMIDWNGTTFNRMDYAQQRAYEARLSAKTYYYINGTVVAKVVYDAVRP